MTPCAGNGTSSRSSLTSPLRRASTSGSGCAVLLGARFRPDVHNQRRLAEHCGSTPAETLDRFRDVITSTTAPSQHTPAYLGEVVVHAQDIRQPLGLARTPSIEALTPVADFFAQRNFTVASRTHAADLQLRADDGPFAAGTGLQTISKRPDP